MAGEVGRVLAYGVNWSGLNSSTDSAAPGWVVVTCVGDATDCVVLTFVMNGAEADCVSVCPDGSCYVKGGMFMVVSCSET